jgi:hypothetical protein
LPSYGTAFFLTPQWLLTCLQLSSQIENGELRVNISEILNFETLQARLDAPPSVGSLVLKPS